MSTKTTPGNLSFEEVTARFGDEKAAREYLEQIRWPKGVVCPHCGNADQAKIWKIEENKEKKIRPGLYQCRPCLKQFTVTVGTIFSDSHIPLSKWLVAWYMICSSKKGISALQMQRMLNLGSYRTAHFMMHRIRHALTSEVFTKKLGGTVEIDETYIGGIQSRGKGKTGYSNKTAVTAMVERQGEVRSMVSGKFTETKPQQLVQAHVAANATIVTDETTRYKLLGKQYRRYTINHSSKEYSRKLNDKFTIHTNTAEGYFGLLKRGIDGTFHHVSQKYLPLYLAEFDHRWNTRRSTDGQRTVAGLKRMERKRLIYPKKTGN